MNSIMEINIQSILSTLVPTYNFSEHFETNNTHNNIIQKTQNEPILSTKIIDDYSFDALLSCILHNIKRKGYNIDNEKTSILEFLEIHTFSEYIRKKKIQTMIQNNTFDNDVKLFLAGYYDIAIYELTNVLRVYYIEDELYVNKRSILLLEKRSDDEDIIKTTTEPTVFKFSDDFVNRVLLGYYKIAIGLGEKKEFKLCDYITKGTFNTGFEKEVPIEGIYQFNINKYKELEDEIEVLLKESKEAIEEGIKLGLGNSG